MRDYRKRLFFVVDQVGVNEEIFETLEEADDYAIRLQKQGGKHARIRVAIVQNAYKDGEVWNYDDLSDTFRFIYNLQ